MKRTLLSARKNDLWAFGWHAWFSRQGARNRQSEVLGLEEGEITGPWEEKELDYTIEFNWSSVSRNRSDFESNEFLISWSVMDRVKISNLGVNFSSGPPFKWFRARVAV